MKNKSLLYINTVVSWLVMNFTKESISNMIERDYMNNFIDDELFIICNRILEGK